MTLKIISAQCILFEGEAATVTLPGEKGSFTVLPRHASLVSTLSRGTVSYRLTREGEAQSLQVEGGLVDVDHDVVSVCIY